MKYYCVIGSGYSTKVCRNPVLAWGQWQELKQRHGLDKHRAKLYIVSPID